ncbi:MAG: DHH family phosphoesterase [bacterium]|nr:DHH family phosphoesterase [bacterium]
MKEKRKIKGQLRVFLLWPLRLSVLVVLMNLIAAAVDVRAGIMMAGMTVIYVGVAAWLYFYKRKGILSAIVDFSSQYAWVQKELLVHMGVPYAIADKDGRLLWMNHAFADVVGEERKSRKQSLQVLFPELAQAGIDKVKNGENVHVRTKERRFEVEIKEVLFENDEVMADALGPEMAKETLLAVYLYDETEILKYKQEIMDQKLVAGLIYLDNYEEALNSVEEVRRSLLTALIDRKIDKYISNFGGIVKRLEKDKYFIALKQKYMKNVEEDHFSLLEEVKKVNIGNEMAVTLSIGLGMNGESYSQNYDYARTAIDMALGRGGDQAVVKNGNKIQYYGGKSQQAEKTTRVKARVKAHALRELMEGKERILIMGHKIGDIDSLGSAIGIYRIATAFNKKAHIVINDVTSSVRPMMQRFMNNSDYPDDLFLTGGKAAEMVDASTMLVVVDVNRPSFTEAPELLKMVKTVVVLDHHRQTSEIIDNAVLSYVEPYASSACEMVAEILQYIADGIKMKQAEADAMYAGIVIDTHNFENQTGVRTFEAAAFLRRSGADVTRVRKLFREKMEDYKARAEAIRSAEIFEGCYAIGICPAEGVESPTIVGAQAANELLDIIGIRASVVLTPFNGKIYLSARSIDEVNVQIIMERLGGGGHRTIAGAQLKDMTVDEAKKLLKETLKTMIEKGEI